jgi:hypothetical protein
MPKTAMGRTRTARFRPIAAYKIGGTFTVAIRVPEASCPRLNKFSLLLQGALRILGNAAALACGASI